MSTNDERYFNLMVKALRVCVNYQPMFGKGRKGGLTLEQFQELYRSDLFYYWLGLDSPLIYTAHKTAGGLTSIYRQLGIGCQWVFNQLLQDSLGLSAEQANWQYETPTSSGKSRTLSLDGRITLDAVNIDKREQVEAWLKDAAHELRLEPDIRRQLKGAVFEVRQGYKSKDAKRQNADIANAANAYAHLYVPALFLFSKQIDNDVASRYAQARWLLLNGTLTGRSANSSYTFCREALDYDLAGFFERNSGRLKQELEQILNLLLQIKN